MVLTEQDFTKNSTYAKTVDVVQPIVKAMRAAGQNDSQIESTIGYYMEHDSLPADVAMDAGDATLIRAMIDRNAQAIERADFISSLPTEWGARGSRSGE